jgi:hypothetical protein
VTDVRGSRERTSRRRGGLWSELERTIGKESEELKHGSEIRLISLSSPALR